MKILFFSLILILFFGCRSQDVIRVTIDYSSDKNAYLFFVDHNHTPFTEDEFYKKISGNACKQRGINGFSVVSKVKLTPRKEKEITKALEANGGYIESFKIPTSGDF